MVSEKLPQSVIIVEECWFAKGQDREPNNQAAGSEIKKFVGGLDKISE